MEQIVYDYSVMLMTVAIIDLCRKRKTIKVNEVSGFNGGETD
jgi:hypothetical protein